MYTIQKYKNVSGDLGDEPKATTSSSKSQLDTPFRHSPRKKPNPCLQSSNFHNSVGKLKLNHLCNTNYLNILSFMQKYFAYNYTSNY